jgi:glycolate oxidase
VLDASYEILKACVEFGGSITGEHGVGVEKLGMLDILYPPTTLRLFDSLRRLFNPTGLLNPGKAVLVPGEAERKEMMLRPPAAL